MTEIRQNKPEPEEEPMLEAAVLTTDTQALEIPTDPSLLYPPKRASEAVGLEMEPLSETLYEEPSRWRKALVLLPIFLTVVLVVVTIVALSVR